MQWPRDGVPDNPRSRLIRVAQRRLVDQLRCETSLAGLALLTPLQDDERLRTSHRLDAVRAHLRDRAGERDAAVELYRSFHKSTLRAATHVVQICVQSPRNFSTTLVLLEPGLGRAHGLRKTISH